MIDDEESIRYTFKTHLEDLGHQVTTFEDPEAMLMLAKVCDTRRLPCFDAIFVDYNMPKMTGIEFLEHSNFSHCKLESDRKILMSGSLSKDIAVKAEKMGHVFLRKPVSLDQLETIVSTIKQKTSARNY